jgi:chromate transporter
MMATLLQIAAMFSLLSLLAFGGGAAVLPDMQRQAVDVHHWLTSREFLDMFAVSRTIPPGSMIVVLIGQRTAGILGGLVALVAMFGPSSLLAYATARLWYRAGGGAWREVLEQALTPVSIGVTIASSIAIARSTENDLATYAVTALTTLLLTLTRLHPLAAMGGGAVLIMLTSF